VYLAYLSSNCHIEMWALEKSENVAKAPNKGAIVRLSRKQQARKRLEVGEKKAAK
jgi:large subunit ribosomal protein L17e